jgi:hypothetical protein
VSPTLRRRPCSRCGQALSSSSEPIATVAYGFGIISVTGPEDQLKRWVGSGEVGIYTDVALDDDQVLSVAIEKGFACLDLSDAENEDTFPNPNAAAT